MREGHALTLIEPTQFPEKFPPLLYALEMADRVLFVVTALSREVAEAATVVDLSDRPVRLVRGADVGEEELRRAFKGMRLASEPIEPYDPVHLREELDRTEASPAPGPLRIPIDHAFPVRGVGAVVLGLVRGGRLEAHARMRLYPTEREVEIRSIQVHDLDVRTAESGDRVGLALKGVEADELSRGQVLAAPGSLQSSTALRGSAFRRCAYYRGSVATGSHLHLSVGLQFVPTKVIDLSGSSVVLETDRPVAFEPGGTGFLADLSPVAGPRLVGRVDLAPL